jgi:hypothetical protein
VSHTREDHRLKVFENRVLRRICGPKREKEREEWEAGEDCVVRSFITFMHHQTLLG